MKKINGSFFWILAAIIPFLLTIIVVGFFSINFFDQQLSNRSSNWGEFGDYVGGLLNPIFGFCSFIALLITIKIQTKQLETSTAELNLSRQELRLTRDELSKSADAQYASQLALNKQAEIAYKSSELSTINFLINTYQSEMTKIIDNYSQSAQDRKVELDYKIRTLKKLIEDTYEDLIDRRESHDKA